MSEDSRLISFPLAFERTKMEEYAKYYELLGYDVVREKKIEQENRTFVFDLVVSKQVSKRWNQVIVFEFVSEFDKSTAQRLEEMRKLVKSKFRNGRLEVVFLSPKPNIERTIQIQGLDYLLKEIIEQDYSEYLQQNIKEYRGSKSQESVTYVDCTSVEINRYALQLSGEGYYSYWTVSQDPDVLGLVIPDPLRFKFDISLAEFWRLPIYFRRYSRFYRNAENKYKIEFDFSTI